MFCTFDPLLHGPEISYRVRFSAPPPPNPFRILVPRFPVCVTLSIVAAENRLGSFTHCYRRSQLRGLLPEDQALPLHTAVGAAAQDALGIGEAPGEAQQVEHTELELFART